MVRHVEQVEPEIADLREHPTLVGNPCGQHPVESADSVRRDDQQRLAQVVDVAHLAPFQGQVGQIGFQNRGARHDDSFSKKVDQPQARLADCEYTDANVPGRRRNRQPPYLGSTPFGMASLGSIIVVKLGESFSQMQ